VKAVEKFEAIEKYITHKSVDVGCSCQKDNHSLDTLLLKLCNTHPGSNTMNKMVGQERDFPFS
jgi:hypothetical protein